MNLIVATDIHYGIGVEAKIPWNFPLDRQFFRQKTTNQTKNNIVIMGSETWFSLPEKFRGLTGRINIVLTRDPEKAKQIEKTNTTCSELLIASSLDSTIEIVKNLYSKRNDLGETFVIGGEVIYSQMLENFPIFNIYLTFIHRDFNCNKFFNTLALKHYQKYKVIKEWNEKETHLEVRKYSLKNSPVQEYRYLSLLQKSFAFEPRETRNAPVFSGFGKVLKFDLSKGFPLLTTKKMFFRGIIEELLFFLRGSTNTNLLSEKGINIWKSNTSREFLDSRGLSYDEGDMGPMYGFNWRHFGQTYVDCKADYSFDFDQLKLVLEKLIGNQCDRSIMMTTFDPKQIQHSVLPPCHGIITQFWVGVCKEPIQTEVVSPRRPKSPRENLETKSPRLKSEERLSCSMYQRSADLFLGLPFNIASYSALVFILCHCLELNPGFLYINLGDTHLYQAHQACAFEQLTRFPHEAPHLKISKQFSDSKSSENILKFIHELKFEDFDLGSYSHKDAIKAQIF
jgi:dihydrofolate reductase/thymidylate synthase